MRSVAILILVLLPAVVAQAHIGDTPQLCEAKWGRWYYHPDAQTYSWKVRDWEVMAVFTKGHLSIESLSKKSWVTPTELKHLLDLESDGHGWHHFNHSRDSYMRDDDKVYVVLNGMSVNIGDHTLYRIRQVN